MEKLRGRCKYIEILSTGCYDYSGLDNGNQYRWVKKGEGNLREDGSMFSVDYETLRQIIQQFMYTGVFQAYITNPRLLPEEGNIELQAKEGNIIACRFVTKKGLVYSWDRWETELTRLGILNWDMTTSAEDLPQGSPSFVRPPVQLSPGSLFTGQHSPTPHHTTSLSPSQISQWPILYR